MFYCFRICVLLLALSGGQAHGQVFLELGELSDGTPNPASSLELSSAQRGFLMSRMTTAQRNAINGGVLPAGLMIYNTDINCAEFWNGTKWASLCDCDCDDAIPGTFSGLSRVRRCSVATGWPAGLWMVSSLKYLIQVVMVVCSSRCRPIPAA